MCVGLVVSLFGAVVVLRGNAGLIWPSTTLGVVTVGIAMTAVAVAIAGVLRPLHRTARRRWHWVVGFALLAAAVALELVPSRPLEHQAHKPHSLLLCIVVGTAVSVALVAVLGWFRRRPFKGLLDFAEVAGVGVAGGLLVLTAFCTSGQLDHVLSSHGLAAVVAFLGGAALARARNALGDLG